MVLMLTQDTAFWFSFPSIVEQITLTYDLMKHKLGNSSRSSKMILTPIERKVLQYVRKHALLPDGAKVLVGLSGGPDSVALLRLLRSLNDAGAIRVTLHALHLNHMIRGGEADADEKFCKDLAATLDIPLTVKHVDVPSFARRRKLSLEEAARETRYGVFRTAALAVTRKAPHAPVIIALGHHADDRVETILQRIVRGTGIEGLVGIPAKRPLGLGHKAKTAMIVRPLLALRRSEILDCLTEIGQTSRIDTSNLGRKFMRNRLRNELLPLLRREYNPAVDEALLRLADIARQWCETAGKDITAKVENAGIPVTWSQSGVLTIPLNLLETVPEARAQLILKHVLKNACIPLKEMNKKHYSSLLELARTGTTGKELHLPGMIAVRDAYAIRLQKEKAPKARPSHNVARLPVGGSARIDDGIVIYCGGTSRQHHGDKHDGWSEIIDRDAVRGALVVRFTRPGERFRPLGAPGDKKVLQFLAERKVPADHRTQVPLVADKKGIIWVVGHRIADRVKITSTTKRMLLLKFSRQSSRGNRRGPNSPLLHNAHKEAE
jgi:tRNA(Ile)-lysidine synthase